MILDGYEELVKTTPPELPIIIITFNAPTYLKQMIFQLDKYGLKKNIIVLDNASNSEKMLKYLEEISETITVVKNRHNYGPHVVWEHPEIWNWLPNKFVLTDPDIGFNRELPKNFLDILSHLTDSYSLYKAGFALDIFTEDENYLHEIPTQLGTVFDWESKLFWTNLLTKVDGNEVYIGSLDTTFAFYNKSNFVGNFYDPSARIAGKYTSQHYGWYKYPPIPAEELRNYVETSGPFSASTEPIKQFLDGNS